MKDKRLRQLEIANEKEVRKRYGKMRAGMANYGWGTSENGVATKVYGNPCMIVTSYFEGDKIKHTHIPF